MFAEKLETLLHRAYHLQEDFGSSIPTDSVLADFGNRRVKLLYDLNTFYVSVKHVCVLTLALSVRVCGVPLAESEGTLILPQVESFHRLHDDDATTVTSDQSFFSAAEVSSLSSLSIVSTHTGTLHICCFPV